MNKNKYIILIFIILSISIFFILKSNRKINSINNRDVIRNVKKNISKRKLISELSPQKKVEYVGESVIISQNKDSIWILDNYKSKIVLYDKELNLLSTYGKKGESPSEHISIKNANFTNNGYYTFDFHQQMAKKFAYNDSLEYYFGFKNLDISVSDCLHLKEDLLLVASANENEKYSISLYNMKNKRLIKQHFIEDIVQNLYPNYELSDKGKDLIFEGYFSKGSSGNVIYSFNKVGAFLVFNSKGDFVKAIKTIDELGIPRFQLKDAGNGIFFHTVVPDFYGNFARGISGNYAYILSNFLLPSYKERRVLDIYDIEKGAYVKSLFINNLDNDEKPNQISVYDNQLFILFENSTIAKYNL